MPIDPECFTGARIVTAQGSDESLINVEYVEDGEVLITFAATDTAHAHALKEALDETPWIEIAKT